MRFVLLCAFLVRVFVEAPEKSLVRTVCEGERCFVNAGCVLSTEAVRMVAVKVSG